MASPQRKDKGKEVKEEPQHDEHAESEESEEELDHTDPTLPQASTPSTSSKKKKKKRSKALKALNALKGHKDVSQQVVDVVLEKVKENGEVHGANEAMVRATLEQMNLKDVVQGKVDFFGKNKKETGGHKVRRPWF